MGWILAIPSSANDYLVGITWLIVSVAYCRKVYSLRFFSNYHVDNVIACLSSAMSLYMRRICASKMTLLMLAHSQMDNHQYRAGNLYSLLLRPNKN